MEFGSLQVTMALSLGFLGSAHCALMCGPIALVVAPQMEGRPARNFLLNLTYNSGRILTYAALGALFGLLGAGASTMGFQQGLSVAVGILILAVVLGKYVVPKSWQSAKLYPKGMTWLYAKMKPLLQINAYWSKFFIGTINGLLPCGLVYGALAGSVAQGGVGEGAMFMTVFGVGTLPLMLAIPAIKGFKSFSFGKVIRQKVTPVVFVLMAGLMIVRGLNLGIPYLSPHVNPDQPAKVSCH